MMPNGAANSFPAWPAMTNLLRNSRCGPRRVAALEDACLASQPGGIQFDAELCQNVCSSRPTYHQIRAINQCEFHGQQEIHPHVFSTSSEPVTMQRGISPFFLAMYYVTNPQRSPQPVHRSHKACRPQFLRCGSFVFGNERCQSSCERNRPRAGFLNQVNFCQFFEQLQRECLQFRHSPPVCPWSTCVFHPLTRIFQLFHHLAH